MVAPYTRFYKFFGNNTSKINPILRMTSSLIDNFNLVFIKKELIEKNPYKINLDFYINLFKKNKYLSEKDKIVLIELVEKNNVRL